MDPVIHLPYFEYETIVQIQRHFKKNDGFSVCVPVSRQQKGIDFVVVNTTNWRSLVLVFSDAEMDRFLDSIWTQDGKRRDCFFYVSFNELSQIVVTRGRKDRPNISQYLLANRVPDLLKQLQ